MTTLVQPRGWESPATLKQFLSSKRYSSNKNLIGIVAWFFTQLFVAKQSNDMGSPYRKKKKISHLKLSPPSTILNCNPLSVSAANVLRWLASSIFHNCSSVCLPNGSKFWRRVPENNTGSYDSDKEMSTTKEWKVLLLWQTKITSCWNTLSMTTFTHILRKYHPIIHSCVIYWN